MRKNTEEQEARYIIAPKKTKVNCGGENVIVIFTIIFMILTYGWGYLNYEESSNLVVIACLGVTFWAFTIIIFASISKSLKRKSLQQYAVYGKDEPIVVAAPVGDAVQEAAKEETTEEVVEETPVEEVAEEVTEEIAEEAPVEEVAEEVAEEIVEEAPVVVAPIVENSVEEETPVAEEVEEPTVTEAEAFDREAVAEPQPRFYGSPEMERKAEEPSGWRCNICGKMNLPGAKICSCGTTADENELYKRFAEVKEEPKEQNVSEPVAEEPETSSYGASAYGSTSNSTPSYGTGYFDTSSYGTSVYGTPEMARQEEERKVAEPVKSAYGSVNTESEEKSPWVCNICGRRNMPRILVCACGNSQEENDSFPTEPIVKKPETPVINRPVEPVLARPVAQPESVDNAASESDAVRPSVKVRKGTDDITSPNYVSKNTRVKQVSATEWECGVCGRINRNYVGTCSCGNSRY